MSATASRRKPAAESSQAVSLNVIDLFCGAGGLTHGLFNSGLKVVAGVDIDSNCQFPFEDNNSAKFILSDIGKLKCDDIEEYYPKSELRVLVGCAPCQPFSRYARASSSASSEKWAMLRHFSRFIEGLKPEIVSMENVPELRHHKCFAEFVNTLKRFNYEVSYSNVHCPDYGIAQSRTRLVLFASRLGSIDIIAPTHEPGSHLTVRDIIAGLPPLAAGESDVTDPVHRACCLSVLNLERISVSQPNGSWRDWPPHLIADCHQNVTGKTYPSVYGRMSWDIPAPTITTQFFGYGNGRFGHPEQNRAISLREGALLQSFPRNYNFWPADSKPKFSTLGKMIGNAVPVRLGEIIGNTIIGHVSASHV